MVYSNALSKKIESLRKTAPVSPGVDATVCPEYSIWPINQTCTDAPVLLPGEAWVFSAEVHIICGSVCNRGRGVKISNQTLKFTLFISSLTYLALAT